MAKSPAFQFYPKDFLTDGKQIAMTLPEVGAYIRLIAHCWLEGSLPDDIGRLGRLCGATKGAMTQLWPALAVCFVQQDDGCWTHPRLEKEREKQAAFSRRQSDKGIASAKQRVNQKATESQPESNRGSTGVQPKVNSSSSISDLQSSSAESTPLPPTWDADWEKFKAAYPGSGREGGFMASQLFGAACESVGVETVMAGLERYRQSKRVRDGFVIGMQKWLEKKLWIQEPEKADTSGDDVEAMQKHLAKMDEDRANRGRR